MEENTNVSLKKRGHGLTSSQEQLKVLNRTKPSFPEKLKEHALAPLNVKTLEVLQINLGKMCNQVCKHCHVDAGPDRKEIMTREVMQFCLEALKNSTVKTVDLTGGAPEMNPDFRWFVSQIRALGKHIIVRCNLTIILANPKYHDLPDFFAKHDVEVVSSLPHFSASRTDAQRGDGVFEKSIKALQMLNAAGYGKPASRLTLNLVYNPSGAFLPSKQSSLEAEFKKRLSVKHGIEFNKLYAITNLPISRFLEYLERSGNYESYMQKLLEAFNPEAVQNVMCRTTLSVGWDGYLYDCDFNQMLELKTRGECKHIRDFDLEVLSRRNIVLGQHCYGCTAGAGSSCGGEVV